MTGRGQNIIPTEDVEEDRDKEKNQENKQVEGTPLMIEENIRDVEVDEEEIKSFLSLLKFKLKAQLLCSFSSSSLVMTAPESALKHYDRFKTKKPRPYTGTPLSCRDLPVFQDFQNV